VAANDPVEQEKDVKFTSLLANLVIFHKTLDIAEPLDVLGQVRETCARSSGSSGRPSACSWRTTSAKYSTHKLGITPERLRRPPGRRLQRARRRREGGSGMTDKLARSEKPFAVPGALSRD
jgi:hypothetical protein